MGIRLVFSLKMLSDYHISNGFGIGKNIDSALFKDQEGNPVIRGSSLSGLMRSAAYEIQIKYPNIKETWEDVFGAREKPKSWAFRSAKLIEKKQKAYQQKAYTNKRRGVRIDPELRKAQDKKLFTKEVGSAGLEFTFEIQHLGKKGQEKDEAALLVAAARMVRVLGSNVNRGYGKCLINLQSVEGIEEEVSQEDLLDHFVKMLSDEERACEFRTAVNQVVKNQSNCVKYHKVMLITKAIEPIIVAQGGKDGNEYDTGMYIPGQTILGAFASKYIYNFGIKDYEKFVRLFRYGGLKFTPLYPCRNLKTELTPLIPMPQDILICKRHPFYTEYKHSIPSLKGYATAAEIPPLCSICFADDHSSRVPMISVDGFLPITWNKIPNSNGQPKIIFEPHLAMREGERRADDGKFFAYNAIEPGQYFYGEITSQDPELLNSILSVCEQNEGRWETDILVGKGITRGYGKLKSVLIPIEDSKLNPLPLKDRVTEKEMISLLFLTDTILLDWWGRTISAVTSDILSNLLGISVEIIQSFITLKDVEGFTSVTGLPKFRDLAIKAGSVIGFKCTGEDSLEEIHGILQAMEEKGLGLRRHEGFGMISFNHVVYAMDSFRNELRPIPNPFELSGIRRNQGWQDLERVLNLNLNMEDMSLCDREFARWLYAHRFKESKELLSIVKKYGELNILRDFSIEPRDKSNRLKAFREQADELLTNISDFLEKKLKNVENAEKSMMKEQLWPLCMEWLADKIVANEEREEA